MRTLVWESPSNSGQLIVIQTVVFVPFSGILPREVVRLTGGLPHHLRGLVRNDREFDKFRFVAPQNDTERVRVKTITDHVRHDLAARPAGKFQFAELLR